MSRHRSIAFSPDLQQLASATGQNGLGSPHGDVKLFDLAAPATPVTLECTSRSVDFAPDGQRLFGRSECPCPSDATCPVFLQAGLPRATRKTTAIALLSSPPEAWPRGSNLW